MPVIRQNWCLMGNIRHTICTVYAVYYIIFTEQDIKALVHNLQKMTKSAQVTQKADH